MNPDVNRLLGRAVRLVGHEESQLMLEDFRCGTELGQRPGATADIGLRILAFREKMQRTMVKVRILRHVTERAPEDQGRHHLAPEIERDVEPELLAKG
jgi:hypothetical protein